MKKYEIIEKYIIDEIESGRLKIGDQIMTELQLSNKFDIGRLTVNKALAMLKQKGYIDRVAGRGSFVAPRTVIRSIRTKRSFSDDMKEMGMKAGSKLIEYRVISSRDVPIIAEYLNLNQDDELYYFTRLRTGDGKPIALAHTYLVAKIVGEFEVSGLDGSMDEYLEKKGTFCSNYETKMSATMSNDYQQKLLQIGKDALLKSVSIRYNQNQEVYEYTETYYISNRFEYSFSSEVVGE
ncbi:GntR family transcriptional regulator [Anaerorhabdus furcosa]|uniref:Regulatory protein, gntR family n=1 Tax=Anaerorhabdus furcosa TaxID=118967 RepID=A0A1T4K7A2_9FIRM|nr:GntR family transcriptional regulator [Anaerorhabdus furcosa]SJZ38338.1 regulatory protein, gntR family [Anaerorhabdus furcosa]